MEDLSALSPVLLGTLAARPTRFGVSVIVCCHNSSLLLPKTLEHLARQVVRPEVPWEVIVVDNASTDGTVAVARRCWPSGHAKTPELACVGDIGCAPPARTADRDEPTARQRPPTQASCRVELTVVEEPRLGLAHARARGITQARYEVLAFVDDDNWLESGWVQAAFEVFKDRPEVGASGSTIEPEFETSRPAWFELVANLYATGPSPRLAGDVTTRHVPCGAGLCLRLSALADAQRKQLTTISVGRAGASLTAGEDSEIIYCLRLAGWRVWMEPRLRLRHFLPARRLTWTYARQLAYWSAYATAERDALVYACKPPRHGVLMLVRRLRETWAWQCLSVASRLLTMPIAVGKVRRATREGDPEVLHVELLHGRLRGLLAARPWYAARSGEVRQVMANMTSHAARATLETRLDGEVAGA
jgi:glycosyltransferase involved in cell wall biosynthesis